MKILAKLQPAGVPLMALAAFALLATTGLAQDAAEGGTETTNPVMDALNNAGIIGYVIIGISVLSTALIIENFVSVKREKMAPPELVEEIEALFDEQNWQEALELCEQEPNYLTNVIQAGLSKLGHKFETIRMSIREMEDEESVRLFQKIGWLSLISATAPMMGLLGTVTGMFVTFGDIAAAGGSVSPAQLAGGIKLALVTTILGLVVAIPVGAFYFVFRNRVVKATIEVNALAEDLFERFRDVQPTK